MRLSRLPELDGLRGWAALSVVVYHATWETFGVLFPPFRSYLPSLVGDGSLAVALFFVLSGYVLTIGRWRRADNPPLLPGLVRRYLRLEVPILVAVLLFWAVMSLHLSATTFAAPIVQRQDWLGRFANFTPDLSDALGFAFARTFWVLRDYSYGPFLWTMAIELTGSFVVLILSHSPRLLREPYTFLLLCIVLLLRFFPLAACFPVGALVALLQCDRVALAHEPGQLGSAVASVTLVAALLVAGWVQMTFASLLPISIVGVVVFLAAVRSRPARAFLTTPLSGWLGRVSFPLYLMQILVLMTLTSWSVLWLDAVRALTPWTAFGVAASTVVAALLLARAFLPIELFTLWLVKRLWRRRGAVPTA